jgi:squalene cyclase
VKYTSRAESFASYMLHHLIYRLPQEIRARNVVIRLILSSSWFGLKNTIYNYIASYNDWLLQKGGNLAAESVLSAPDENRVDSAIQKAAPWLEDRLRKSDDHYIHSTWQIWDTAKVVLALLSANIKSAPVKDAVDFILNNQKSEGGFRFSLSGDEEYCIETTSLALMAAYKYNGQVTSEINDGINFLIGKQSRCGGWELPYLWPGRSELVDLVLNYHPSVTGFALQALLLTKSITIDALEKALNFLFRTQLSDGSWGRSVDYYSTEGYAISSISSALALVKKMNLSSEFASKNYGMLSSCLEFARRKQNVNGSWSIKGPSTKALATSLFLQGLSNAEEGRPSAMYSNGIDWLIKAQHDRGFWEGGTLGYDNGRLDVFVTAEALIALSKFRALIH